MTGTIATRAPAKASTHTHKRNAEGTLEVSDLVSRLPQLAEAIANSHTTDDLQDLFTSACGANFKAYKQYLGGLMGESLGVVTKVFNSHGWTTPEAAVGFLDLVESNVDPTYCRPPHRPSVGVITCMNDVFKPLKKEAFEVAARKGKETKAAKE